MWTTYIGKKALRNILLVSFFLPLCSGDFKSGVLQSKVKILYVGNSLTYTNDLPALVAEIAKLDEVIVTYTSFLFPDYSLEDHWSDGKVKAEIEKGGYDFVIAQQGPSALPESQLLLLASVKKFAEVCNRNKSKLALYMVWPSKARSFDMDNVISSYTNAATKTSSLLCPAGLAWKNAWLTYPEIPLYSPDNFHPSITGSVLAALTIYGALADKNNFDFIEYHSCSWKKEISKEQVSVLTQTALKALSR